MLRLARVDPADTSGELGDVHTASAVLTLDGGALAVVSNTRYNARGHDVRLEVHGTRDSLAAGLGPGLPLRSAEPGVSFPDGKPFTFFMDRLARDPDLHIYHYASYEPTAIGRLKPKPLHGN